MLRLLMILPLWAALGCGAVCAAQSSGGEPARQPSAVADGGQQEAVFALIRETDYFGLAPAYTLTIYPDGAVAFIGTTNVRTKGLARGRISRQDLQLLIDKAKSINVFSLRDKYGPGEGCPVALADAGSAYLHVSIDGRRKFIDHYLGCEDTKAGVIYPRGLAELEYLIDQIANSAQWIK